MSIKYRYFTDLDTELLVSLIQQRPVLWDKTDADYRNRLPTNQAWLTVCGILKEDFVDLSEKEQDEFADLITKKWRNIRDSWTRTQRKKKGSNLSGSATFAYQNRLSFLKKSQSLQSTESSVSLPYSDEEEEDSMPCSATSSFEPSGTSGLADSEILISLIRDRPIIWDKKNDEYNDRLKKNQEWLSVCRLLKEDFDEMSSKDQKEYMELIIRKWRNIRDVWTRALRKNTIPFYGNQLSFLKKSPKFPITEYNIGDLFVCAKSKNVQSTESNVSLPYSEEEEDYMIDSMPGAATSFSESSRIKSKDAEILISLVRDRPIIWDKTNAEYNKDRLKTKQEWLIVSRLLREDFDELSSKEQKEYMELIGKKWRNIRDSWTRTQRKNKEAILSGSRAPTSSVYENQLNFLEKSQSLPSTEPSISLPYSDEEEEDSMPYSAMSSFEPSGTSGLADSEVLISLIRDRPVIWDMTCDEYKDRWKKNQEWLTVCRLLKEDFDEISSKDQKEYMKLISKRWRNIRDVWTRAQRRIKEGFYFGSETSSSIYEKHLSFLKENFKKSQSLKSTESSVSLPYREEHSMPGAAMPGSVTPASEPSIARGKAQAKRKRTKDPLEQQTLQNLDTLSENINIKPNRHLSFMEAILPSIECFNEMDILEFQAGIVQLIKKIRLEKGYDPQYTTPMSEFDLTQSQFKQENP